MPEANERRRCPRLPLSTDVEFRRKREAHYAIPMHDLTPFGCAIASPESLAAGEMVWVKMPSLQSLSAEVKWTRAWLSGVEFDQPLHSAVFDMMASRLAPANDC